MNRALRDKLIEVAAAQGTVHYSDLESYSKYEMNSPYFGALVGRELDDINQAEHDAGRPLLSAVVLSKRDNLPGPGFFHFARESDLMDAQDDHVFWRTELQRVYEYWSTQRTNNSPE